MDRMIRQCTRYINVLLVVIMRLIFVYKITTKQSKKLLHCPKDNVVYWHRRGDSYGLQSEMG